jgi:hypothetical protein
MMAVALLDRAVARVLFVQPRPAVEPSGLAQASGQPFGTPLLISAVRCTVGYIVVPFVLPLLGMATGAAFGVLLVLDAIAAISIVITLRRLWQLQHPRRWQYLPLALILAALFAFFLLSDARGLRL